MVSGPLGTDCGMGRTDTDYEWGLYDAIESVEEGDSRPTFDATAESRLATIADHDIDPELDVLLSQSVEILYEKEEERMGYWWTTSLQDERDIDLEADYVPSPDLLQLDVEPSFAYDETTISPTHQLSIYHPERNDKFFDREKVFPCGFAGCDKRYAKSSHLKAHVRRHTGEKPFLCDWEGCSWKFSRSDELARHRRSHSGVKPYKCGYCEKRFARSDHLAKHTNVHRRDRTASRQRQTNRTQAQTQIRPPFTTSQTFLS